MIMPSFTLETVSVKFVQFIPPLSSDTETFTQNRVANRSKKSKGQNKVRQQSFKELAYGQLFEGIFQSHTRPDSDASIYILRFIHKLSSWIS